MKNTIQKIVGNSELNLAKDQRFFLAHPAFGLAPCALEETEDSVVFNFKTTELEPATEIKKKPQAEKLRFLINCSKLEPLCDEYQFSLSPDNLLIDINLVPNVMVRNVKDAAKLSFITTYKALIAAILLPKYTYDSYVNGGEQNYKKHKLLAEIASMETVAEIQSRLFQEYTEIVNLTAATKTVVSKYSLWAGRIAIPLLVICVAVLAYFAGRMYLQDIPFRDSVIEANTAYIQNNFLAVQQALRSYDVEDLSTETKFILSRSYVSTEALSDTQRANILIGLGQRTDTVLFDYWILLGRLQFEDAAGIARHIGDNELLLFAYLKHEIFVRQDFSMPADERSALLQYLETNIDRLNQARDAAEAAFDGTNN